jgi:hypothetical protein
MAQTIILPIERPRSRSQISTVPTLSKRHLLFTIRKPGGAMDYSA